MPFVEVGLVDRVSRGEEDDLASACRIVTMYSASDDFDVHLVDSLDVGSGHCSA